MKKTINKILKKFGLKKNDKIHPTVFIGEDVRISKNVYVDAYSRINRFSELISGDSQIMIGKYCAIAPYVMLRCDTHSLDLPSISSVILWQCEVGREQIKTTKGNIIIGSDVWIGHGVSVLGGIKIGDGAVIGAGAVVTRDVEPYSIYGGIPAKMIRYRFSKDKREQLLKLKWWNWNLEKIKRNKLFFSTDLNKLDSCIESLIVK